MTMNSPKGKQVVCAIILATSVLAWPLTAPGKNGGLQQTGLITVAEDFDGVNTQVVSFGASTNLFDKQGRLLETISARYDSRDGRLTSISTNTPSYDKRGNLISEILELDADANGTVDTRSVSLYTNLSANSYYVLTSFDNGADGHTDGIFSATHIYDDDGRPLGVLAEMDSDADGVVDVHSIGLWTYRLDEHQATYVLQNDLAQPGVLQIVLRATYTLNDDGFPVSGLLFFPYFQVGEVQGTAAFTYDKFGNRVQYSREVVFPNGEGSPTISRSTTTWFYGHRGELAPARPFHADHDLFQLID